MHGFRYIHTTKLKDWPFMPLIILCLDFGIVVSR